jgi:tetratricopeptide (TPR) repeat protein
MEDGDAFLRATSALQQNNSWHLAERLVQQRVQSARSLMDAHNLNALGYKLAENGRYPQQFVAAEAMTRRALIICDETVALLQRGADVQPEVARSLNSVRFSRANIRDSLAWSLFRQKRFLEALDEQERAVTEALSLRRRPHALSPTEINRSLVELHYHLGEIYRALRRYREARAQYQLAQKIGTKHAASAEALRTLPDSEIAPRSNTQPKTVAQRNTDWL